MLNIRRQFVSFGKPALAAGLVGMILLLDAMAACPELHELIHKDANEADHHCAVTVFAQGKVDLAICEVPIVKPTVWFETALPVNFPVFSAPIENLPRGRAPPLPCPAS